MSLPYIYSNQRDKRSQFSWQSSPSCNGSNKTHVQRPYDSAKYNIYKNYETKITRSEELQCRYPLGEYISIFQFKNLQYARNINLRTQHN